MKKWKPMTLKEVEEKIHDLEGECECHGETNIYNNYTVFVARQLDRLMKHYKTMTGKIKAVKTEECEIVKKDEAFSGSLTLYGQFGAIAVKRTKRYRYEYTFQHYTRYALEQALPNYSQARENGDNLTPDRMNTILERLLGEKDFLAIPDETMEQFYHELINLD